MSTSRESGEAIQAVLNSLGQLGTMVQQARADGRFTWQEGMQISAMFLPTLGLTVYNAVKVLSDDGLNDFIKFFSELDIKAGD